MAFSSLFQKARAAVSTFSKTEMVKREAVIAHCMKTGLACYPHQGGTCARCVRGPCPGPVEKYDTLPK